ncbi:hypothetical protein MY5147_009723 [Beauveria neobassiana]
MPPPLHSQLVAAGDPHIDFCDALSGSALGLTVDYDDKTALDTLLKAGANPWETSGFSHPDISPLDAAIQAGNSFLFQRLRQYARLGDDENTRKRYRSLLLKASSAG